MSSNNKKKRFDFIHLSIYRSKSTSNDKPKRQKRSNKVHPDLVMESSSQHDENDDENLILKYQGMTVPRLKEYLRRNKQFLGGKKEDLVSRCIDGERNGALPICLTCGKGQLRLVTENVVAGFDYDW